MGGLEIPGVILFSQGGTIIFSYICRLGLFLGLQNLEFQYFLGLTIQIFMYIFGNTKQLTEK